MTFASTIGKIFRRGILINLIDLDDIDLQLQQVLLQTASPRPTLKELLEKLDPVESSQEGVCGVCYEELTHDLLACPKCCKAAHTECIKEWLGSGQEICLYCRYDLGNS